METMPDWVECVDIRVIDDAGEVIYNGPRWFRCARDECRILVTQGMIHQGGCHCGNRRLKPAYKLTEAEIHRLQMPGEYELAKWEKELIFGKEAELGAEPF
jgi:hypothetical protein